MRNGKVLLFFMFLSCTCFAEAENDATTSSMNDQLERLSKVNFHPNLLPIILNNSDYIELTPEQVTNVIKFLHTLVDTSYLENEFVVNPFK